MARPSRNTDRLFIEAGKSLIPQTGFKGLRIRDVAKKAGVNLGMFNYHFKTRERFIEILLSEVYGEFLNSLEFGAHEGENCRDHLKNALTNIAVFVREHRSLIVPLVEELISGNKGIMKFAKDHMSKHFFVLFDLINECKKKGYIAKDIPTLVAFISLVVPIVVPNVIARLGEKYYLKTLMGIFARPVFGLLLSDKMIQQRVSIGLKGVSEE